MKRCSTSYILRKMPFLKTLSYCEKYETVSVLSVRYYALSGIVGKV